MVNRIRGLSWFNAAIKSVSYSIVRGLMISTSSMYRIHSVGENDLVFRKSSSRSAITKVARAGDSLVPIAVPHRFVEKIFHQIGKYSSLEQI